MKQQLSEPLKAILLKIALELKKLRWNPDSQSNEIDVFQGHLGMAKEWIWGDDKDLPGVSVGQSVDMTFSKNEQNGVYFLIYSSEIHLFIDSVGGKESQENGDLPITFTEQDINNVVKIQEAAKQINQDVVSVAKEKAYEFASESYSEWKNSSSQNDNDGER